MTYAEKVSRVLRLAEKLMAIHSQAHLPHYIGHGEWLHGVATVGRIRAQRTNDGTVILLDNPRKFIYQFDVEDDEPRTGFEPDLDEAIVELEKVLALDLLAES